MSEWDCRLQFFLASPAQSFSGPSPAGLMTIFLLSQIRDLPTRRARSLYFYLPGTGWPGYTPSYWVPFSSPPTARRATVDLFDPASKRDQTVITSRHGPQRKHSSSIAALLRICCLAMGTCLPSCCPETALVYSPISRSLHRNRSTHYSMLHNDTVSIKII
jgi:hypothetical protein